jgi:hypothetical protein
MRFFEPARRRFYASRFDALSAKLQGILCGAAQNPLTGRGFLLDVWYTKLLIKYANAIEAA